MSTTEAENRELVREGVTEVLDGGNWDAADEWLAEDYIEHTSALPEPIEGRDAAVEHYKDYHTAFPDFDLKIEDLIAEGDKVVQRSLQTGTHEGPLLGIEPTGEEVEFQAMVIHRIEDGKDVESWVQIDVMGVLQQLGVVEPPGQ